MGRPRGRRLAPFRRDRVPADGVRISGVLPPGHAGRQGGRRLRQLVSVSGANLGVTRAVRRGSTARRRRALRVRDICPAHKRVSRRRGSTTRGARCPAQPMQFVHGSNPVAINVAHHHTPRSHLLQTASSSGRSVRGRETCCHCARFRMCVQQRRAGVDIASRVSRTPHTLNKGLDVGLGVTARSGMSECRSTLCIVRRLGSRCVHPDRVCMRLSSCE